MFGSYLAFSMIFAAIEAQRIENEAFEKALDGVPHDLAALMRKERAERQERQRQEAVEERRHRELCEAIRSTSFWRPFK